MKNKIGTATCRDCGYTDCDVGTDKNGHPYAVCWGECDGEQYFTKGKRPKVLKLLETYKPIDGKPTADDLRAKYGLTPAPAPGKAPEPPAPVAKKKTDSGLLL